MKIRKQPSSLSTSGLYLDNRSSSNILMKIMKKCAGDRKHEIPAHLAASAGTDQIQAGGETRTRGGTPRRAASGTGCRCCVTPAWRWGSASSTSWTSAQPTCPWSSGGCPTFKHYTVLQCPPLQAPLPRQLAGRGGAGGGLQIWTKLLSRCVLHY